MKRINSGLMVSLLGLVLSAQPAAADCDMMDFAGPFVRFWLDGAVIEDISWAGPPLETMADARCHQNQVIKRLQAYEHVRVGYKAALTSQAAQAQFGVEAPLLGILWREALERDGHQFNRHYGGRTIVEADLLVRVGDAAINQATTDAEILAGLEAVLPFIEIGDLMVAEGQPMDAKLLTAMNVGARAGVADVSVPVTAQTDLKAISVEFVVNGETVSTSTGAALMGDPLDVVRFIIAAVAARGEALAPGDVLSLGSLGPFQLAKPEMQIQVTYTGLGTGLGTGPDDAPITMSASFD